MADRVKFLLQKRVSLKSQITGLTNLIDKGGVDKVTLKLRIARLTDLYHAFEEYNDELAIADPNNAHHDEFQAIQERFYALASRIDNILYPASTSTGDMAEKESRPDSAETTTNVKVRRIKLPEAPLPTFDGKFENWLSFKNAFHNMIASRTDVSDLDKLHYLKSALIAEAANKTKIFESDGINYAKAWELLERSYEVKRILISRHLSAILNLTALDKETTSGLSRLADDTQQHIASLNALGVSVTPEMIVHIIESKLLRITLEKWETTLERDEFPKLDQIYEFFYKTAVCASRREKSKPSDLDKGNEPPAKKRRQSTNRAFLTNSSQTCVSCKAKRHPLYLCEKFKKLSAPKRIEIVKSAKLCYNCLRSHPNSPCKFSSCTVCQKRHNTLLHIENYTNASKIDSSKSSTNPST